MEPKDFVSKVVSSYNKNLGIFSKKINAEELIPSGMSDLSKALYIFYVLQLDYAMKSQTLYNGANLLFKKEKEFFTPKFISSIPDESLAQYLKLYLHPRYINEALKRYRINTETLITKYQSDPRNIFKGITQCNDVLSRLKNFRGFGPKIGNFFVRTMINTFGYTFPDIDTILPPVDIHDVRIAYLLGYTNTDDMSSKNIDLVKNIWNKACIDCGESWLIFDKALWLLGSEGKPKNKEDVFSLL